MSLVLSWVLSKCLISMHARVSDTSEHPRETVKRLISVPVRVSDTHRTLVIAAKADREVRDKRACQGSRHARNAYNGVKDEPRHALISVPARVSGAPRATQHGPRCAC